MELSSPVPDRELWMSFWERFIEMMYDGSMIMIDLPKVWCFCIHMIHWDDVDVRNYDQLKSIWDKGTIFVAIILIRLETYLHDEWHQTNFMAKNMKILIYMDKNEDGSSRSTSLTLDKYSKKMELILYKW